MTEKEELRKEWLRQSAKAVRRPGGGLPCLYACKSREQG